MADTSHLASFFERLTELWLIFSSMHSVPSENNWSVVTQVEEPGIRGFMLLQSPESGSKRRLSRASSLQRSEHRLSLSKQGTPPKEDNYDHLNLEKVVSPMRSVANTNDNYSHLDLQSHKEEQDHQYQSLNHQDQEESFIRTNRLYYDVDSTAQVSPTRAQQQDYDDPAILIDSEEFFGGFGFEETGV
jgi:hypothetical protein